MMRDEDRSPLEVERVPAFEGHIELNLIPQEFETAALTNPDLVACPQSRFFPKLAATSGRAGG